MEEVFFCRSCHKHKAISLRGSKPWGTSTHKFQCTSCEKKTFKRSPHLRKDKPGELTLVVLPCKVKDREKFYNRLASTLH